MANNLFVLGLDTSRTKAQITQELQNIIKQISNGKGIRFVGGLDVAQTQNRIQQQLNTISKNLHANVNVGINATNLNQQVNNINQQLTKAASNMSGFKLPFQIDIGDPAQVKSEIDRIVSQITNNQGQLMKYRINLDADGNAYQALLSYRNELNEVTDATLRLKNVGSWKDANGIEHVIVQWSEGTKILSQNIEQTIKANQRQIESDNQVLRKKQELIAQMQVLNTQASKAGISLDSSNQQNFNNLAANPKTIEDIREMQKCLSLARTEYRLFNSEISKGTHASSLERMKDNLAAMPKEIDLLEARFKSMKLDDSIRLQIEQLRTDLQSINNISNPNDKIAQYNSLISSLQNLQKQLQITGQEQRNYNNSVSAAQSASILNNNIVTWINQNKQAAQQYDLELKQILVDLQAISSGNGGDRADVSRLLQQFRNIQSEIKATDSASQGFFSNLTQQLSNALETMLKYQMAYKIINEIVGAFRDMIVSVEDLDAVLTTLNRLLGVSSEELSKLTDRAYNLASVVGRTGKDVLSSVSDFKRAGFDIDESFGLSKAAIVLMNVSDGLDSASESASDLIAVLKGYHIDESDVMSIVDKIDKVGNESAIEQVAITEALKKVSGTMYQTGTSLDQTIGLITGAYSQLRDISKSANSLITISQRLRGIDESGDEIDGYVPKLEEAFRRIGISIEDTEGELKSTYDILKEYSEVFPTLTSEQKQYYAELSSGKRSVNVFNAIIQGFQDVDKAVEQSVNSLGTAEAENEIYKSSLLGLKAEMTNAFDKLAIEVINSDWLKNSIKTIILLLNALSDVAKQDTIVSNSISIITESLKALSSAIKLITGHDGIAALINGFLTFKAVSSGIKFFNSKTSLFNGFSFAKPIADATRAVKSLGKEADNLVDSFENISGEPLIDVGDAGEKASKGLAMSTNAAKSLKNALVGMGISLAISAFVSFVSKVVSARDEILKATQDISDGYKKSVDSLDNYQDRIIQLRATLSDETSSTEQVTSAKEELLSIQGELVDMYKSQPEAIEQVINMTDSLTDSSGQLAETIEYLKDLNLAKALDDIRNREHDFSEDVRNWFDGVADDVERAKQEYGEFGKQIDALDMEYMFESFEEINSVKQMLSKYDIFGYSQDDDGHLLLQFEGTADKIYSTLYKINQEEENIPEALQAQFDTIRQNAQKYSDEWSDEWDIIMKGNVIKNAKDAEDYYKRLINLDNKYHKAKIKGEEEELQKYQEEYSNLMGEILSENNKRDWGEQDYEWIIEYFKSLSPMLAAETSKWEFKVKLTPELNNGDMTRVRIEKALGGISKTLGREVSDIWLKNVSPDAIINPEVKGYYNTLQKIAENNNLEWEEFVDILVETGDVAASTAKNVKDAADAASLTNITQAVGNIGADKGINTVLNQLEKAYDSLFADNKLNRDVIDNDFLSGIRGSVTDFADATGMSMERLEEFFKVITSADSSSAEMKQAFEDLSTECVRYSVIMDDINEETADAIKLQLENAGYTQDSVEKFVDAQLKLNSLDNTNLYASFSDALNKLEEEKAGADELSDSYDELGTAKESQDSKYNNTDDLQALINEQEQLGYTREDILLYLWQKSQVDGGSFDNTAFLNFLADEMEKLGQSCEELREYIRLKNASVSNGIEFAGVPVDIREKLKEQQRKQQEKADEETRKNLSGLNLKRDPASSKGSGGGSSAKEEADKWVKAYEDAKSQLDKLKDQGLIDEKTYLDYLRILYSTYFGDLEKYGEQYANSQKEYLNGMKSLYTSVISFMSSKIDKEIWQ